MAEAVPVNISTRAFIGTDVGGVDVGRVRLIAIDAGGNVVFNRFIDENSGNLLYDGVSDPDGNTIGDFIVTLLPGVYDFHAVVNEFEGLATQIGEAATRAELENIRITGATLSGLASERDLMCAGFVEDVEVRAGEGDDAPAQVRVGDGEWSDHLNITARRTATKVSIDVRNASAGDSFSITGATLSGVPAHAWLIPRVYSGATESRNIFSGDTPVGEEYTSIVEGYILPEYILNDPADAESAVELRLTADYTLAGGSTYSDVEFDMTLPGGTSDAEGLVPVTEFSMPRGTHYRVHVTVTEMGGFDHYIVYEVADWMSVSEDPTDVDLGGVFGWDALAWDTHTTIEDGKTVRVPINGSVVAQFTMTAPESATWVAHLTNTADFEFDEVNGVRRGVTRLEMPYTIVIRPRGIREDDVSTELYITASNGTREVELDLNPASDLIGVGAGNRYVIKQIPR
jgi:hypothetical protein